MSVSKRSRRHPMMHRVSHHITYSRQPMMESIDFQNKRPLSQSSFPFIPDVEISGVRSPEPIYKRIYIIRPYTGMKMSGHECLSAQKWAGLCNWKCKSIETTDIITLGAEQNLITSGNTEMVIFHNTFFSKVEHSIPEETKKKKNFRKKRKIRTPTGKKHCIFTSEPRQTMHYLCFVLRERENTRCFCLSQSNSWNPNLEITCFASRSRYAEQLTEGYVPI